MSIMGINHYLTSPCNMAVTAMFEELSLPIIKPIVSMINCRGVICESNLFLFFMFTHDLVDTPFTQYVFTECLNNFMCLNPWGVRLDLFLLPIGGLDE